MNFEQAISTCMMKFATFSGRASKNEFLYFYFFNILIEVYAVIAERLIFGDTFSKYSIVQVCVGIVFLTPMLAVGCRRLHDTGRSGWWLLLIPTMFGMIPLLFWWLQETKPAGDRYNETQ